MVYIYNTCNMSSDHNHNHNHNRPIDQPPPAKKLKRLFTEYDEFIGIIKSLSKKYDSSVLSCNEYTPNKGLKCSVCQRDKALKGTWTRKYCENFNYNKIKTHIHTAMHKKRLTDDEKKNIQIFYH